MNIIDRARHYVASIDAESGHGGHSATFRVALALIKGFDLPYQEAWAILVSWNETNARPPWSEAELRHKLAEAAKSNKPTGYLLDGEDHDFDRARSRPGVAAGPHQECAVSKTAQPLRPGRATWPTFREPTAAELDTIAQLRRLPASAVLAVHQTGLLKAAKIEGHECFIITENDFAQARRFDGGLLPVGLPDERTGARQEKKAKNLWGSQGAFIGESLLGSDPQPVLLVEGCIGLLEAVAAIGLIESGWNWTTLAATSAGSRFERAPELLNRLRGRHILIVPDFDKPGTRGAESWAADLSAVGCQVDGFDLSPYGIKDLGEAVADPHHHEHALQQLFTF